MGTEDSDWMAYIDTEVGAVCQARGWRHQIRRRWSVREKPVFYINWGLAIRKIVGRSIPLFDGLIGLSDTCGYLCLLAYVGCVSILVRGRGRDWPPLKRAAWRVIIFMPIAWIALFIFAIWDPFGMLGYFFR
jgi:hypothetical protein